MKVLVDTDNALGSPEGNVDDAWALAVLWASHVAIVGVSTVYGNTSVDEAQANTRTLAKTCGYAGPVTRGASAPGEDPQMDVFEVDAATTRILALGPLTNVAVVVDRPWAEIVVVGSNTTTLGRYPPHWPHEFNLTADRRASRRVFAANVPLTFVPIDVADSLRIDRARLERLEGSVARVLRCGSERWLRRRALRFSRSFRVCDLVAALYLITPESFRMRATTARMRSNTFIDYGRGERPVTVCDGFDPELLWDATESLINSYSIRS